MAVPEPLLAFVKEALARGTSRGEIETVLLTAGWEKDQVTAALRSYAEVSFLIPVPRPAPYLSAREAFLYLLLFTTLYLTAFNLGRLLFQFINLAFPDPASSSWMTSPEYIRRAIRWSVSTLVVSFPLFLYLHRFTTRELERDPTKRTSKVRRWLTYLTLFISASVVMGDVISLLNGLLSGELTMRFVLKSLTVAVMAGAAFWYYLRDLRRDEQEAVS